MSTEHLAALRDAWDAAKTAVTEFTEQINTRDENPGVYSEEDDAEFNKRADAAEAAQKAHDDLKARMERIEKFSQVPANTEKAPEPAEAVEKERRESVNFNTRTDPFENLERVDEAHGSDLRARALSVIESHLPADVPDSAREGATEVASRQSNRHYDADLVNRSIIERAAPAYLEAFERYARTNGQMHSDLFYTRTAMSLTAANGGVLVPQHLDPTINLTNAGTANSIRTLADVIPITVDQWDGVTSAGATAAWGAEASTATDGTPTFVGPTITPARATAWLFGSYEVLADAKFDEVGMLIADAYDRLEETGFTTGNGSNQPWGLISRLSGTGPSVAGSSGDAGAAHLVLADVYACANALTPRYQRNAKWQACRTVINTIRQLPRTDQTTANPNNFWVDLNGAEPPKLIGYELFENASMDSTIVSGSNDDVLLLGDHKNYKVIDRVGTTVMYQPMIFSGGKLPTGEAGWYAFKRTGGDVITSNAFKLLRI